MSSTDRKINIYTFQPESLSVRVPRDRLDGSSSSDQLSLSQFSFSLALEGHMDWVRALDFSPPGTSAPTTVTESPTPEVLLASGSQDGYIRLWSLVPIEQVPDEGSAPAEQREGAEGGELDDQMLKDFERKIGGGDGDEGGNVGQVSMKAFVISTKGRNGKWVPPSTVPSPGSIPDHFSIAQIVPLLSVPLGRAARSRHLGHLPALLACLGLLPYSPAPASLLLRRQLSHSLVPYSALLRRWQALDTDALLSRHLVRPAQVRPGLCEGSRLLRSAVGQGCERGDGLGLGWRVECVEGGE